MDKQTCYDKLCENKKCGSRETPLWRYGWKEGKRRVRLCNACGLRFQKGNYCVYCHEIFKDVYEVANDKRQWIRCEKCEMWAHKCCAENVEGPMSGDQFVCADCKKGSNDDEKARKISGRSPGRNGKLRSASTSPVAKLRSASTSPVAKLRSASTSPVVILSMCDMEQRQQHPQQQPQHHQQQQQQQQPLQHPHHHQQPSYQHNHIVYQKENLLPRKHSRNQLGDEQELPSKRHKHNMEDCLGCIQNISVSNDLESYLAKAQLQAENHSNRFLETLISPVHVQPMRREQHELQPPPLQQSAVLPFAQLLLGGNKEEEEKQCNIDLGSRHNVDLGSRHLEPEELQVEPLFTEEYLADFVNQFFRQEDTVVSEV